MADPLKTQASEGLGMRRYRHGTDDVWSNVTLNGRRLKWRELYELEHEARLDAERWRGMVADLDRNPRGRHEGDADNADPTGVSQGGRFVAGEILGHDISGRAYVFPPKQERHRFESWLALQI